uniref:Uncharacterized protein n=2 Tax=Heterorhabditis bacteriophora TaxID=37862 RepID=A0A1I7X590_HETBA
MKSDEILIGDFQGSYIPSLKKLDQSDHREQKKGKKTKCAIILKRTVYKLFLVRPHCPFSDFIILTLTIYPIFLTFFYFYFSLFFCFRYYFQFKFFVLNTYFNQYDCKILKIFTK